jgi:hypothetical protein
MDFEETVYQYGHVMYRLGRMETDGQDTGKEYNKKTKEKEELAKKLDEFFKKLKTKN